MHAIIECLRTRNVFSIAFYPAVLDRAAAASWRERCTRARSGQGEATRCPDLYQNPRPIHRSRSPKPSDPSDPSTVRSTLLLLLEAVLSRRVYRCVVTRKGTRAAFWREAEA